MVWANNIGRVAFGPSFGQQPPPCVSLAFKTPSVAYIPRPAALPAAEELFQKVDQTDRPLFWTLLAIALSSLGLFTLSVWWRAFPGRGRPGASFACGLKWPTPK